MSPDRIARGLRCAEAPARIWLALGRSPVERGRRRAGLESAMDACAASGAAAMAAQCRSALDGLPPPAEGEAVHGLVDGAVQMRRDLACRHNGGGRRRDLESVARPQPLPRTVAHPLSVRGSCRDVTAMTTAATHKARPSACTNGV